MKKSILMLAALLGTLESAQAQSQLPPCPNAYYRHDCFGAVTHLNGDRYVGEYSYNRFNGQGTFTWANGTKYVGEWKGGQHSGQGTFTFGNGRKYVGEFKDGNFNGQGKEYSASGAVIASGIYSDGKLVSSQPTVVATDNQSSESVRLKAEAQIAEARERERLAAEAKEKERLAAEARESERLAAEAREREKALQAQRQAEARRQAEEAERQRLASANREAQERLAAEQKRKEEEALLGRRVALVIGNGRYERRPLANPVNDANDMSAALKSSGFRVIDLRDAELGQMRRAVREFGDLLLTHDVGLVFYAGHGVEVKGRNYFIPVNADIQREDEIADQGLDVSLILEKMTTAKKGVNLLIVDACRDDPFGRSFRSTTSGLASMEAPRGTLVAYATSPGRVAADGTGRNSPYTKHLLRAMQEPNKPVELVFKEVRRAVQAETQDRQTPWENTSLSGDFYFRITR